MKAYPRLEHGRWLIDCPRELCWHAMLTPPSGRKKLRCDCTDTAVCVHGEPCDQAIELVFPKDIEKGIAVLRLRPARATHNWLPGETVDDLIAENLEHGLAVP